ncbi:hypothetical protein [Dysgonomonas sp. 520]|uniref:hypothetical protein n=1 Tax=Dysgonomonas sp. 520 TaxID=2302931 RepID=UPI0013D3BBC5|nr:hypothetical protein [Dysgonomonas sp. 520]
MKDIIKKFMPSFQQDIISENEDAYRSELDDLEEQIHLIPDKEQSTTVHAHFFYAGCDWFILSWNRDDDILYCYAILNCDVEMSELGYTLLSDLKEHGRIELDFYWEKKSLAQAKYDKYPEYFPEPKENEII